MLNFTAGPVQCSDTVKEAGGGDIPYVRTEEFSEVILENERMIKKLAGTSADDRAVFLTGSGTAAMEAAVLNAFDARDRVLIVNGGTFGRRFAEICSIHGIPYTEIKPCSGKTLSEEMLAEYDRKGFTGMLVNLHETSTGVLYDFRLIGRFCRRNHLFLIVDAVSAFLADEFDMSESGADIMITGSQKALACPPGLSVLVLSSKAVSRVLSSEVRSMYFNLKEALRDGERGQTPFTPAAGLLLQLNVRLKELEEAGGAQSEQKRISELAKYFRSHLDGLSLEIYPEVCSNAVTALRVAGGSAYDIFRTLKDEYGIWVCPNGGELREKVFRVGHMGDLKKEDFDVLISALHDLQKRGILKKQIRSEEQR